MAALRVCKKVEAMWEIVFLVVEQKTSGLF
ncbi:MAG: hypothetical protein RL708_1808 [Bacteroidota bacterium]|jgi:hypothetical protein